MQIRFEYSSDTDENEHNEKERSERSCPHDIDILVLGLYTKASELFEKDIDEVKILQDENEIKREHDHKKVAEDWKLDETFHVKGEC